MADAHRKPDGSPAVPPPRPSGEYLHDPDDALAGDAMKILAALPDAVVATDPLGIIFTVNPAFLRMLGVSADAMVGQSILSFVSDEDRRRLEGVFWSAHLGHTTRAEITFEASGNSRRLACTFGPMQSAVEGGGVVGVGRDLTHERSIEEQFARADKLATVGRLAAGVVHEINNPLTAICAYADHLAEHLRSDDPQDGVRIARISEAAGRIQTLVRRLLAYAPSPPETPVEVPMGEVVLLALGYCEHLYRGRRVEVTRRIAPLVPRVMGVRGELIQVLVNLITNACHSCPASGGMVDVQVDSPEPRRTRVVVRDNGHGISPENLPKIFEPFFTTHNDHGAGTGLGLVIVQTILEQHRAEVSVESTVGVGTTFTMVFPCVDTPAVGP